MKKKPSLLLDFFDKLKPPDKRKAYQAVYCIRLLQTAHIKKLLLVLLPFKSCKDFVNAVAAFGVVL